MDLFTRASFEFESKPRLLFNEKKDLKTNKMFD